MSSASSRSAASVFPVSVSPLVPAPPPGKPVAAPPASQNPGTVGSSENTRQRHPRKRGRTQRGLVRPRCPEHGGEMLVGRTVGAVQYRYCTVAGCDCAVTTYRSDAPHKRWPPASHQAVTRPTRGGESENDTIRTPSEPIADGATIITQESPVTPLEWPVGRPLPGQSS